MSDRKVQVTVQKDGHIDRIATREKALPEVGEYAKRVRLNRFGQARRFDITIEVTSPVASDLLGAVARIEVADD